MLLVGVVALVFDLVDLVVEGLTLVFELDLTVRVGLVELEFLIVLVEELENVLVLLVLLVALLEFNTLRVE
ncbi:hypothetical protein GCM10022292_33930 [Winogradskyella damuponensis]|uniref:Uncharacterized protein n=1 Tax=Winogradskyella damuponensis TaxID=943939 RepID=A0ABP8D3L2_9FLAO